MLEQQVNMVAFVILSFPKTLIKIEHGERALIMFCVQLTAPVCRFVWESEGLGRVWDNPGRCISSSKSQFSEAGTCPGECWSQHPPKNLFHFVCRAFSFFIACIFLDSFFLCSSHSFRLNIYLARGSRVLFAPQDFLQALY
jgi:hypothetical protein